MLPTKSYAVDGPTSQFKPFQFQRRAPGPHDVVIKIEYCGICHSDIHQARNEWQSATYPMVPGHEIVGKVIEAGSGVTKFKLNDQVGVGCYVDSCRTCQSCYDGEEVLCEKHVAFTYNSTEMDLSTPTFGGYSSQIVVDENFVLRIPNSLKLANAAPLLCAGITTYSPLKRHVKPGDKVAIMGLGGLGHMGIKLAAAMGAEVTVFSTSPTKEEDARRFGAKHFVSTKKNEDLTKWSNHFNFILDAISAPHDINMYLNMLKRGGTMTLVGVPTDPFTVQPFTLISNRRNLAGSLIGGIQETQEMLDYCASHKISADVEVIPIQKIEDAYERTVKSDVKYRFVIDMSTL